MDRIRRPPPGYPQAAPASAMKFARQLTAVLFVVAVVTALGVAWEHSSEARWIAAPQGAGPAARFIDGRTAKGPPPGQVIPGGAAVHQVLIGGGGAALDLHNIRNLDRTAEIEAGVMAAVVALDVLRRRRRRARRATQ
jgi:hypothetical protein